MATYRQIHTHIWDDPDFETLSPHAKLVFIYGFSNKHRNEAGLYTITIQKLAFETSLSTEEAETAVREIEAKGMWRYDWDNQVLWVKNALKYQTVTEKNLVAIKKDIATINSPLVAEFEEYYSHLICSTEGGSKGDQRGIKALPKDGKGKGKGKGKGNIKDSYVPKFQPEHMELAEHLLARILQNKPNYKRPRSLDSWANTMRLMVEQDHRSPERLRTLIDWCQSDGFWWRNVLSADKLRDKFDQLEADMLAKERRIGNSATRASPVYVPPAPTLAQVQHLERLRQEREALERERANKAPP